MGDLLQFLLGGNDIFQGGSFSHISAVEQGMNSDPFETQFGASVNELIQLVNMRMHVPIRKEAYEMNGPPSSGSPNDATPQVRLEDLPCLKGPVYQSGALFKNSPCSQGIVPHFAVAHILIGWKPHSGSMGSQLHIKVRAEQAIQGGRFGQKNRIAFILPADTDAVHNDKQEWSLTPSKRL